MLTVELLLAAEDITAVINRAWDAVDRSKVGPIIRDIEIKNQEESWKPGQKASIMATAAFETYKIILTTQLAVIGQSIFTRKITNKEGSQDEQKESGSR